ncbi:MAG: ABC transporter permease subunit, partial [Planctomycetota bacterium]|nr:ABC transporter permease subunit [Planctomycetota bacterium]
MAAYFARRLLLLIPTFIGITMLVFGITRFVPGGPIDQWQMQMQMGGAGEGGASSGGAASSMNIDPKALDGLKKHYHFDWPIPKQYLQFIGPLNLDERGAFGVDPSHTELITWECDLGKELVADTSVVRLRVTGPRGEGEDALDPTTVSQRVLIPEAGTVTRFLVSRDAPFQEGDPLFEYQPESGGSPITVPCPDIWSKKWSGLLAGDLGKSYKFEVPVMRLVVERFPISLRFGLTGFLLAYLICIPLGVLKAVKHSGRFDIFSSVVIFIGYSIPGWALGAVLLMLLGGGSFWDVMPLGGVYGEGYEDLDFWGKVKDSVYHMILPVISYSVGSFAVLTVLMKNSL